MNGLIRKEAPLDIEFKAGKEPGSFTGYGAYFGNKDDGGDIIVPGAFKKMRLKKNGKIRVPIYHDMQRVVGEATVEQDAKGLKLTGALNMAKSFAQDAYEDIKDGTLDAMSVGFRILEKGAEWSEDYTVRTITKAELWEVSLVPFGMNRKAKLSSFKDATGIGDIRQFEAHLHDIGFSRKDAKAIASNGFGAIQRDAESPDGQRDADRHASERLAAIKKHIAAHPITY